jgi:hypothetical protein
MPTINPQIAVTANDGSWSSTFNSGSPNIRIGNSGGACTAFFRFTGITLAGTITAAYLDLRCGGNTSVVTPQIISAEDAASPSAPTSVSDGNGRIKTTATVPWNLGAGDPWVGGTRYNTPSLVSVVQELMDSYGPYNNGVMQFFIADNGSASNVNRIISDYSNVASYSAKLYIEYVSANAEPTVVCVTADGAVFGTPTPTLEFIGSDDESDDLRYQVQISTNPDFLFDGVQITDSEIGSGPAGLNVHPNPDAFATTWEGKIMVDDRVGQVFRGAGGILDKIDFNFSPHETYPEHVNGEYLCRIYAIEGVRGDNVPVWQASTAYTVGQMVRNTSVQNADQQFLYICITAGTSGGTQPTWTEIEDGTINDGSVVWEAHRGAGPLNYASPANTPTPGWLAQSDIVAYNPGGGDPGWKTCSFTGTNRIRLEAGTWYCASLDWWPANRTNTNAINVHVRQSSTHPGNCYLDGGAPTNNGPRVGDDTMFRAYEEHVTIDAVSGTDAGFANTEDGGDTDPFTANDTISYTVQAGDELESDVTYYWRVLVADPGGSNQWSDWTTTRIFAIGDITVLAVEDATHAHTAESPTLTQSHNLVVNDAQHAHVVDSVDLTQLHNLTVAQAGHAHTVDSVGLAQLHNVLVAGVLHGHSADSVVLQVVDALVIADALHAHTADSVILTQVHQVLVADGLHEHMVDNVTLIVPIISGRAGALMVIAGSMGRLFSRAAVSNLHGARLAAAARGGTLETILAQAPGLGMAGTQLAAGPVSGQEGVQLAVAVLSSQQFGHIAGTVVGGAQGASTPLPLSPPI